MPFCLDNSYIYALVKAIAEVNKLLTSPRLFFFPYVMLLIRIRLSTFIRIWIPIQPETKAKQNSRQLGLKTNCGIATKFRFFHHFFYRIFFTFSRNKKNFYPKIAEHTGTVRYSIYLKKYFRYHFHVSQGLEI